MDQQLPAFTSSQKENQGERKAIGRKAEERRAHEPAPTNVAFRAASKLFVHNLSPAGSGEALPSLWRQQRGESVLLPRPQGKGDNAT